MKSLILALLLIPSLLLAHEVPGEPPEAFITEAFEIECESELRYATFLAAGRQKGITLDQLLAHLQWQSEVGNLRDYSDEVISYMIDIVLIVYNAEDLNSADGAISTMREVEKYCMDYVQEAPKPKESGTKLST